MAEEIIKPAEPKKAKNSATGSLLVRGPQDGRWRGDRHFTSAEIELPLASLSDDQIAEIEADPVLSVKRTGG